MSAFLTRQQAEDTPAAPEIYAAYKPPKGKQRSFRRMLQHYADLVICPRIQQHISAAALNAQRLAAAQRVINASPAVALNLARMANAAPRDLPFNFTELDAFRIAVDAQQMLAKAGK